MSCNFPLAYFELAPDRLGNKRYKICPTGTTEYFDKVSGLVYRDPITVPCGKCIGCRLDYARQWAIRIQMELLYHDDNAFITLTYDNDHLPLSDSHPEHASLKKRDVQLFMKRLRKKYPDRDIRYYFAGEYGPQTMRPHYHAIIFGWFPDDAFFWKLDKQGHQLFTSDELSDLWQHKGFVSLSKASMQTGGYCARYVTSKLSGSMAKVTYDAFGIEPPFALTSRRPAIAYRWFLDNIDKISTFSKLSLPTDSGTVLFSIPRYFLYRLELTNPELFAIVKERLRSLGEVQQNNCIANQIYSDLGEEYVLSERLLKSKIHSLKRGEI